jgi:hypothetical protein
VSIELATCIVSPYSKSLEVEVYALENASRPSIGHIDPVVEGSAMGLSLPHKSQSRWHHFFSCVDQTKASVKIEE